jgi:murein DD-endopeptidase MepM/ murein hydrolase activator NlpD
LPKAYEYYIDDHPYNPPLRWVVLIVIFLSCANKREVVEFKDHEPKISTEEIVVKRGEVFGKLVENLNFISDKASLISWFSDSVKILNEGDTLRFIFINDTLRRLEIRKIKGIYEYDFISGNSKFSPRFREYITKSATLVIENTLWDAFIKENLPLDVFVRVVDIFAWDIDFSSETQKGDTLKILYSPSGIVYYAEYVGKVVGRKTAVRFMGEYYDENGKNLRKEFLRSPLKIYTITSGFGVRFHPILKVYRPHHGVDYGAPYGSPVYAVAEGVVKRAGWMGGYGKAVIIRHSNGFETLYGHLSSILVKVGDRVEQGRMIGRVGSTGLSTGPHLHFEVRKDGKLVNPLKLKFEPSKPLPEDLKEEFAYILETYKNYVSR